jgi:aryl sulfotransferase
MDSTRWDHFNFRDGDIVVGTWAKTGTTWIQQLLGQLIFAGEQRPVMDLCPWVEHRYVPIESIVERLEAQNHRRFVKTHLPADALHLSPLAKYLYIGRDGRDAVWSWHHHQLRMTPYAFETLNAVPGRVGPPLGPANPDPRQFFNEWLDGDGYPVWPFWPNVRTWWEARHRPNVLLVHFNNLKRDLPGEARRIARFLGIDIPEALWELVLEHCTFDYMKANGAALSEMLARGFVGGANDFVYRGTNGRWRDVLTPEDIRKYEASVAHNLSPACAHWLATGELTR